MLTTTVTNFEGYRLHEFFQNGFSVGCVVVTSYRRADFQVTHVDLRKNVFSAALKKLSADYLAAGKELYCDKIPV